MRTFGKLLVKRIQPSDANRSAAEGIIRESDRLQDLLKQLDAAIDLEADDLIPLLAAPLTVTQSASQTISPSESASEAPSESSSEAQPEAPAHPSPSTAITQSSIHPSAQALTQPFFQPLPPSETRLLLGSAIDLQPHSISEVLQPLLDSATVIAQDRQLTLCIEIANRLPQVWLDLRALREVLNNLIDNALKYTPAGGQVYVSVRRVRLQPANRATVTHQAILIADTGPGIPTEDLHHLFERHYRGVQAKTDIPGTGLGLAIARDLVRQMQGEIEIFSPALDCKLLTLNDLQPLSPEHPGTAAVVWLNEVK
ncbi:MAG: ATP-binding protein [Cyanobacteria bacterium RM1_2_2]|nr:ATP-binding protein [Cyanobacteria bacterium RM1_2_2]